MGFGDGVRTPAVVVSYVTVPVTVSDTTTGPFRSPVTLETVPLYVNTTTSAPAGTAPSNSKPSKTRIGATAGKKRILKEQFSCNDNSYNGCKGSCSGG